MFDLIFDERGMLALSALHNIFFAPLTFKHKNKGEGRVSN
jgi:hypothetical protein